MEDIFLSTQVSENRILCLSPLSARTYRESGGKGLGGDYGYFLYEMDPTRPKSGITVIAKAAGADEAETLFGLISAGR
jgi:hypothetical protein